MYRLTLFFTFLTFLCLNIYPQKKAVKEINDSNTPLHLLAPDYKVPYGELQAESVKTSLDRVLSYLDKETPALVINKNTQSVVSDYSKIDENSQLKQGAFRLASYEWGVTYSGMLEAAKATSDMRYNDYVADRFKLLSETAPYFRKIMDDYGVIDPQMKQMLTPHALDDAGSMCAAMIKFQRENSSFNMRPLIDNYMNYIMYKEHRLYDGTFARNRPQLNTLWLDDMYMSIPATVNMGRLTNEAKYFDEAAKQIRQFSERMFVKEKGLFMHGWVQSMTDHPAFFWGRANGWALLTLTEVLEVLPKSHPDREYIMDLYKTHIRGISKLQSGEGFWHQLLDRNDSYLETSATAIFVYCIARGINNGWIDALAYGPVAQLGWLAVSTKINEKGQVEGTCVGTGMAFDPAFYYHRPINVFAAHGYGPVLLAGAEMINLLNKFFPRMNDSAVQYYTHKNKTTAPIFDVWRPTDVNAGSTRIAKGKPVAMLIGDSTVKNGSEDGNGGQWGWGTFFQQFFDSTQISVENHALGGRSSRTFYTEGLWDKVLPGIEKGDYLFIQFGHNDGGSLNTGRARASLKGIGNESETVVLEKNGSSEEVFTFGHYLRIYIRQAKAQGAIPVVLSPTPNNRWTDGKIRRLNDSYGKWAKEVAKQENVAFIDLNTISADKFDRMGEKKSQDYYKDSVHTGYEGAILNGESVIEGLKELKGFSLLKYLKK